MDFALSEEQRQLAASARSLAEDLFGASVARRALNDDHTAADKGWAELRASGLTTLLVPEEAGGGGATLLDACVVLVELSSALAPVAYLASAVAAPLLLRTCDERASAATFAALCSGAIYGVVVDDRLHWPARTPELVCLDWAPGRAGLLVDRGTVHTIEDFAAAPGIDPLHPVGFTAAGPATDAADGPLSAAERRALAGIRVAAASALTGCLAGAATLAWDYVRTREQYGKTIGSFQAVQHLAADLLVDLETCRSVSLGAAWQVDNEPVEIAERTAAVAKAWCGQTAVRGVETAVQLLGGIGVTWESTAHLYLRNVHLLSAGFGDTRTLLRELGSDFIRTRGGAQGAHGAHGAHGGDHGPA